MIKLEKISPPKLDKNVQPVQLTDTTMATRKAELLTKMQKENYDVVVIYADLEHGGNFEYFTGFVPRFEEALLVIHQCGEAYLVLGNENLNKVPFARIKAKGIHMPHFSLPNQPMETTLTVPEILKQTKLEQADRIGPGQSGCGKQDGGHGNEIGPGHPNGPGNLKTGGKRRCPA